MIPPLPLDPSPEHMTPFANALRDIADRMIFDGEEDDDWRIVSVSDGVPFLDGDRTIVRYEICTVPYVKRTKDDHPLRIRFSGNAGVGRESLVVQNVSLERVPIEAIDEGHISPHLARYLVVQDERNPR